MRKKRGLVLLSAAVFVFSAIVAGNGVASDDSNHFFKRWFGKKEAGVPPVKNSLYSEECGSCHFAYPPALLPAASWKKVMASLDDHFGENAELPGDEREALTRYLVEHAAENARNEISRKFLRSLRKGEEPVRISRIPYFVKEHDEIPQRMVKENPEVGSFSRCDACHTDAAEGRFDEHAVRIPRFGRWEDD